MMPTKVEIKLKKPEASSWGLLEYPKSKFPYSNDNNGSLHPENNVKDNSVGFVEGVDLEDL